MAVLIIFPVILQTVINLIMLSIGGQGVTMTDTWQQIAKQITHVICRTISLQ